MNQHCPDCGGYHPTYTGGCPYKDSVHVVPGIPVVEYPNNPTPKKQTIEDRLDEIIRLLREIECHVRKIDK
jgi:hypothetical protein